MDAKAIAESIGTLNKSMAVLLAGIIAVAAYLCQRAVDVFVYGFSSVSQTGVDQFSGAPQTELFGLKFAYFTLSLVWPAALGVLCTAFVILRYKLSRLSKVSLGGPEIAEILSIDPYFPQLPRTWPVRFCRQLAALLPLVSIILFGIAQAAVSWLTLSQRAASLSISWVLGNTILEAGGVAVGLALVWSFRRAFLEHLEFG